MLNPVLQQKKNLLKQTKSTDVIPHCGQFVYQIGHNDGVTGYLLNSTASFQMDRAQIGPWAT